MQQNSAHIREVDTHNLKLTIVNKVPTPSPAKEKESDYQSIFDSANDGMLISDLETGLVVEANTAACLMHGYAREEFIGLRLTALVHIDGQNVFSEHIQAFQSGGAFDIRTLDVSQDGSTFNTEWRGTAFTYRGRPCLLAIVRDVSKRIGAEQLLQQRVEAHTHEQATLLEISHTLASTLEFHPDLILKQLREIVEYTHGALFGSEGSTLVSLALRGTPQLEQSSPLYVQLPDAETLDMLFNGHRPVRVDDASSNNPEAQFLRSLIDNGAAVLLEGMQSWIWAPLAVKSRMIGGVVVAHEKKNFFTPHHADLALSVANQAAITMINAELYADAQTLAVLKERQRLARNLHDAVNQSLFSAGLIAEVLPRLWEVDQEEARRSLEDLRRLTRGALAEMRALLAELRPSTLTDADLGDLLRLLANAFTGRTNIKAKVTVIGKGALLNELQVAVYRVCQEALNNVAKHAGANLVKINLKYEDNEVELSIRDDGRGFDPKQTTSGHYGLSMMHERAEAVGAKLIITSLPGRGTDLTMRWIKTKVEEA